MCASPARPTPPPRNARAIDTSPDHPGARDGPPQSPDGPPVAVVAQRRVAKAGAFDSPLCRSSRLSCLPPPPPPIEFPDLDESSDNESESINDVALHLSRDETPENDGLPPDEPSSVLANKIMRAHDNPSPPPQNLAHPGVNYVPGKDGQFPLLVSVPPSPFRPINLLERLNQFPDPLFDPSSTSHTPNLDVRPDMSKSDTIPSRGFISLESSSCAASVPIKSILNEDLVSAHTIPSSSIQCAAQDFRPRSPQHVCEPVSFVVDAVFDASQPIAALRGQLITTTSSLEAGVPEPPPARVVDPSPNPALLSTSPQRPLPPIEPWQSTGKPSPLLPNTGLLPSPPSDKDDKTSPSTEAGVPSRQDNDREGSISSDKDSLPPLGGERESKCRTTDTKKVDASSLQRQASPLSADVLALELSPSNKQTVLPSESILIQRGSATPPQTPARPVAHPHFSRTSVQRPVIVPTPVRADCVRHLNSSSKLSLEVNGICRTPAQRVPIETALARGTSSLQRTAQLAAGAGQSRAGRFPTITAPVFTRPALDDPSRSPAKRIAIADSVPSPARRQQAQSSPTQLGLRSRSASVEPRPLGSLLARSRSAEPSGTALKTNHGKIKKPVFPVVPMPPRFGTRLPFPLVPCQKSSGDLPPPILEEHENEVGSTETDITRKVTSGSVSSQLRQPSTNTRIPRIGNKPYARPPKNGKATAGTTTANVTHTPRAPPFQLACKNNGVGDSNAGVSSTQLTNDQRLVGSLKRKRGGEAATPSNSHPVMIRQVVPGILNEKYAPKPAKLPSQIQAPSESGPQKVPQPIKFRKVVDGMLSARYAVAKANPPQTEQTDSTSSPPSPLSDLSSLSDEGSSNENPLPTARPLSCPKGKIPDIPRTNVDAPAVESSIQEPSLHQDADDKHSSRPRRTSRTRKPAQQQYVLDVFNSNTTTRPSPARRRPQPRAECDLFMGMSLTALKALTTSNTTRNQQTVAVLATEVIRKEGLRPESPTVKARTILQKQRDERDMRRKERAQRRDQIGGEGSGDKETEGQSELDDRGSLGAHADHDENDGVVPRKHRRGPGDEEDYETPERPERVIEPLRLEGLDGKVKSVKQVRWHRGLSTAAYLDEVDPRPRALPKNIVVRGCLAPTSKSLPLDSLGNLVDLDNRPSPELVTEHVIVKKYIYDNDIEPEPIPPKTTRSKSKKNRS